MLLSEARIVSEAHESWEPQPRPFPVGNFDPRTAIFRAREAYRERTRAKATADRQSAGAEAMTGSAEAEDLASSSPEDAAAEPSDYLPRGANAASTDREILFRSPEAGPWSNGSIDAETTEAPPALSTAAEASGGQVPEGPLADRRRVQPRRNPRGMAVIARARRANRCGANLRDRPRKMPIPKHVAPSGERETFPDWYRSDLPRICRTCRDYRPSADAQRGWCANSWAFTHRRLVLEDDPAPCQSAIGDWWLPVDDVWLVAADVSSHGRATPLLDRLTAKAEQQRRRS